MSRYELSDGAVAEGFAAHVMRELDRIDPLDPDRPRVYADGTTRAELLRCMGEDAWWCASIGRAVVRADRDMFDLRDDDWLQERVETFLSARLRWAVDQRARHPDAARQIEPYVKFCQRQDSAAKARDMKASFKAHRPIAVSELDTEPSLMGTPLGVLDLDTGEMPADEADMEELYGGPKAEYLADMCRITRRTGGDLGSWARDVERKYDARWDEFVLEVMGGDAERAAFLQRALGYSLYGGNPEKATFVLWGPKRDNGKSTLMNAVKTALGDYAGTAGPGLLLQNRFENYTAANPVLAGLVGKRLVDVSEPPLGAELNGAMVKKLASGTDEISTRHLHRDEFSYVPQFTVWMHCNALPVVSDPSAVDPRHMFVVEFPVSFSGAFRDIGLAERFSTPDGMSTVLSWMVDGYLAYKEQGLNPPRCVTEATEQWLVTSGTWLDRFVSEHCVLGAGERCLVSDFRDAAYAYADGIGEEPMTVRELNKCLRQLSIVSKSYGSVRNYKGVSLKPSAKELAANASEDVHDVSESDQNGQESSSGKTIRLI